MFVLPLVLSVAAAADPIYDVARGDVFVAGPAGASITVDGTPTNLTAPATVIAVPVGRHVVGVRQGCSGVEVPIEVRPNAIERVDAPLVEQRGHISVAVNVWGATIRVDGKDVGAAPVNPVEATCGKHIVEAVVPGYRNATTDLTIQFAETVSVTLTMVREEIGNIAVGVTPLDASVWVDGLEKGTGPMTVSALPSGMHMVEAKKAGFETAKAPITVTEGNTTRVDLTLLKQAPLGQRLGLERVPWWQVGVATGLTAAAGVTAFLAVDSYTQAEGGYAAYTQLTYADDPEAYYATNVEAPRTMATVWAVSSGVRVAGAGLLWGTIRLKPASTASVTPILGPGLVGAVGTF